MKNAIEAILNEMERRQTQILPAGSERFFPLYEGSSLVNLPASIFRWLGAEPLPAM